MSRLRARERAQEGEGETKRHIEIKRECVKVASLFSERPYGSRMTCFHLRLYPFERPTDVDARSVFLSVLDRNWKLSFLFSPNVSNIYLSHFKSISKRCILVQPQKTDL